MLMYENDLVDLLSFFFFGGMILTFGALFGYHCWTLLLAVFKR